MFSGVISGYDLICSFLLIVSLKLFLVCLYDLHVFLFSLVGFFMFF